MGWRGPFTQVPWYLGFQQGRALVRGLEYIVETEVTHKVREERVWLNVALQKSSWIENGGM